MGGVPGAEFAGETNPSLLGFSEEPKSQPFVAQPHSAGAAEVSKASVYVCDCASSTVFIFSASWVAVYGF
jgi:hypothetical protein